MKRKLLSVLLCLAMALSLLPTAALAEGTGATADFVTLELTYGSNVTAEQVAAAKAMYEGKKYETCKAANEAYMALYGVGKNSDGVLDVVNNNAPLRSYVNNTAPVTEVKFYIHGTLAGFTSLLSAGNQIDCTVGGNHQIARTSISIIGVDGSGSKAKLTDGNVQAYVAGGYDNMYTNSGKLTIDNIEFRTTNSTTVAASAANATSGSTKMATGEMEIKNCKFNGRLYVYDNFENTGMTYNIHDNVFDGSNYSGDSNAYPIFAQCRGGNELIIKNNNISGFARGINIDHANIKATIDDNTISITDAGRACIQLSSLTTADIKGNTLNLTGGNAITLHEKLLTMSTAPEVSIENNTITGTGYLIYDDAAANNKSFTSDKLKLTYSSNTVPSTVDTTKGVKGSKETALTGYVAAVAQGKYNSGQAAQVGTEYYETLTEAFAALNETNHTLTLIDGSAWDAATPVYWAAGTQSGYVAKLTDALTAAYKANAGDITIVCRPGADVGEMTHGHVADNLTIYGNNAYLSDGECDLEVDEYKFSRTTGEKDETNGEYLTKDITITAYELDNLGVWGTRHTDKKVTINLTDCDGKAITGKTNVQRVYISGTSGVNNITLKDCDFITNNTSVYSNADGAVVIDGCSFTGSAAPANFNHKANGEQTVTVKNSTFTNCGDAGEWKQFAAPIRFVNSGSGTMSTEVTGTSITGTVGNNGDILLGDGRTGETSNDVTLTVKDTAANVQAQKPGYYDNSGSTAQDKVSKTKVAETEQKTIELKSSDDFKLVEVAGTKYSDVTRAITAAQNGGKVVTLLTADDVLVQAILDGQYGSIDGLTIELPTGNYGQLELGRATKYPGSNTEYHTFKGDYAAPTETKKYTTVEELKTTLADTNTYHGNLMYIRSLNNITLKAATGANVNIAGVSMKSAHIYGTESKTVHDYVLNNDIVDTNKSFWLVHHVNDIKFEGLNFTGNVNIASSLADALIDGVTFDNCSFTTNGTESDKGQALRYYNENNNGKVSDLKVINCTFNNCYQGVYTGHIKNVTVTDSSFTNTGHNAIAIQNNSDKGTCNHGNVVITRNTFANIGDRIIRFNTVGADTQITITNNTATNSGDRAGEVIKANSLADGITYTVRGNNWGSGTKVANDQLKDTAAPSYSGSSSDPTYSVSTPSKTENGSVTVSPKSASKGDTVTVTVKPDSGYVLETLTVTDKNGNELTLKDKGNGKYTFTMPSGKVEVKATFMEDNSMLNFFYDVPNDAYFYEAVKWAVKNGITTGVGDNLFAPEQPCTRAQIVTFLWRAAGSPEPKGTAAGMTDVVSGSYYEKAVAWAIENGITTGTTTSTFSPDATCTRAQAVTFLARALNAKAASAAEFSDVPTDSYFADAVAWAAANGVTEGIGGGLFGSDNDCTRGQIVTFLYRAYNK
ncbi:S-layer homology domain-containing protein [Oscillibacter sp. MSJ-31]|uniref:S-layer homology domain-containing protein n=1 Tax=Oscillibacter sp. MSJ-31 TaxID=2841526 RepID=UPI001C12320E|nr:S-layer homology domain-containing protein [Oscillibacter sp. MSJ-31]MBU5457871.1 S-layer homology domain-containing protein [Oscillibacter sp. MSJ-31]